MCCDKAHFCIFSFLDCPSMQFRLKSGSSAGEILPPFKLPRDLPLALSATRQTPLLGGKLIASRLGKLKTWKTQGFENQTWKTQQSHNYTVERLKNLSQSGSTDHHDMKRHKKWKNARPLWIMVSISGYNFPYLQKHKESVRCPLMSFLAMVKYFRPRQNKKEGRMIAIQFITSATFTKGKEYQRLNCLEM